LVSKELKELVVLQVLKVK